MSIDAFNGKDEIVRVWPKSNIMLEQLRPGEKYGIADDGRRFDNPYYNEPAQLITSKNEMNAVIDTKTRELIAGGFTYDGKKFSLSLEAQINWTMLIAAKTHGTVNDPEPLTDMDNDTYDLASADIEAFFQVAVDAVKEHLTSGRLLKKGVVGASDFTALKKVAKDER